MDIHPTAVVSPKAELGQNVKIGPYTVIEEDVVIGDDTEIAANVVIGRWTEIGKRNRIFSGAIIGTESQDLKYKGWRSFTRIGDGNVFREYVTVNRATAEEGSTIIGNDNAILSYCHVAHDCILGNRIIISNVSTLAGHCIVEDRAGLGGYVGVHQFVRIGSLAYVGGWSKVVKDVCPYTKVSGTPLKVYGLNSVGLERSDVSAEARKDLRKAYQFLYRSKNNVSQALDKIRELPESEQMAHLIAFLEKSERGITK